MCALAHVRACGRDSRVRPVHEALGDRQPATVGDVFVERRRRQRRQRHPVDLLQQLVAPVEDGAAGVVHDGERGGRADALVDDDGVFAAVEPSSLDACLAPVVDPVEVTASGEHPVSHLSDYYYYY